MKLHMLQSCDGVPGLNPGQWDPESVHFPQHAMLQHAMLHGNKGIVRDPPKPCWMICPKRPSFKLIKNVDWIYSLVVNNEN